MHIWTLYTTRVPHDKINTAKSFLYQSTFVTENTCQVGVSKIIFLFFLLIHEGGKNYFKNVARQKN